MKLHRRIIAGLCVLSLFAVSLPAAMAAQDGGAAETRKSSADNLIHYATGFNPQDYPCARAGMIALYEKREDIANLGSFHPKRAIAWVVDTSVYYTMKFVDFLKGLMNPNAVANGIRKVQSMARGGNPLAGLDRKVDGWIADLNPRSQYVLKRKMANVIEDTTNADGSCKN